MNSSYKKHLLLSASCIALFSIAPTESVAQTCGGTKSRTVECYDFRGNVVGDHFCDDNNVSKTADQQTTTMNCNEAPCPPPISYNGGGETTEGPTGAGFSATGYGSPGSPNGCCGGGGSTSGGGGTVLCTYFHREGNLSEQDYYVGFTYSLKHLHPLIWRGYHFWAIPYVSYLYKNPNTLLAKALRAFMKPLILHRGKEISYKMGFEDKPDYLGKLARWTFEPASFLIGLFVEEKDYSSLYTKEELVMFARKYKNYNQKREARKKLIGTPLASFTA